MIILFGGGPNFGLPEVSPYVTKTEVQLQMAGLPYRKELARPEASPKGQLPFIDDGGEKIADSHFIRMHIERKYGFDFDAGLTDVERAQAWAFERMLENHFGWVVAYTRWIMPENFAKGPARFFDHAPEEVREKLRAEVQNRVADRLLGVGIMRHSETEIFELGLRSLSALSLQLGDKPCLFGDQPTGVDATAFAMLASILTPHFDSPLRRHAEEFDNLAGYVARTMRQYYPEHRWSPAAIHAEYVVRDRPEHAEPEHGGQARGPERLHA